MSAGRVRGPAESPTRRAAPPLPAGLASACRRRRRGEREAASGPACPSPRPRRAADPPTRARDPALAASELLPRSGKEEDANRPVLFSSSKANPSRWTVEHSLGRKQQRPWWKVLPFSLSLMILVIWCFLRQETGADRFVRQVLEEEVLEASDRYEEPATPAAHGATT